MIFSQQMSGSPSAWLSSHGQHILEAQQSLLNMLQVSELAVNESPVKSTMWLYHSLPTLWVWGFPGTTIMLLAITSTYMTQQASMIDQSSSPLLRIAAPQEKELPRA